MEKRIAVEMVSKVPTRVHEPYHPDPRIRSKTEVRRKERNRHVGYLPHAESAVCIKRGEARTRYRIEILPGGFLCGGHDQNENDSDNRRRNEVCDLKVWTHV